MSDKSKTSTFSTFAKGLLSRPTTSSWNEGRTGRQEQAENSGGKRSKRDMCYKAESTISAIASSPGTQQVVIAGREILKVLVVDQDEIRNSYDLRGGYRVNLNYSSNDVQWGIGATSDQIATATSNGSIVTWRVDFARSKKSSERAINGHNRAVNRLAFNPGNGSWLLSASQDGSMKLWDLRERDASARFVMHGKAEAVRDVEFNSTNALELAAVYDNGTLQKWDLRNPKIYERKLNAHHGPALALNWHADGRHLVTGGRDKIIKFWDMNGDMRKPVNYLHTMAPVAQVAWRPGDAVTNCEVASCSFSMEHTISLWSLRRPYVASRVFESHQAVATGILWKDRDVLWSCSKDQTFRQHVVDLAPDPMDSVSHCAFGWSSNGDIALCLGNQRADKLRIRAMQDKVVHQSNVANDVPCESRKSNKQAPIAGHRVATLDPHLETFRPLQRFAIVYCEEDSVRLFRHLAQNYVMSTGNPAKACASNALVAYRANCTQISKSWKMIKLALEHIERRGHRSTGMPSNTPPASISRLGESLIHRDLERLRQTPGLPDSHSATRPSSPSASFIMPRYKDSSMATLSSPSSRTPSRPCTADSVSATSFATVATKAPEKFSQNDLSNPDKVILPEPSQLEEGFSESQSWTSTNSETSAWHSANAKGVDQRTSSPISDEESSRDLSSSSEDEKDTPNHIEDSIATLKPTEGKPVGVLRTAHPHQAHVQGPRHMPEGLNSTVRNILDHYRELGDVQTCSTICLVLSDFLPAEESMINEWLYCYIELLRRHQLFTTATEVINSTKSDFIQSLSESDIVAHTSCARCKKSVPLVRDAGDYWMCNRCQNTVLCIVCGIVVKGQASWCLSCGHTSHPACHASIRAAGLDGACVAPDCHCDCGF